MIDLTDLTDDEVRMILDSYDDDTYSVGGFRHKVQPYNWLTDRIATGGDDHMFSDSTYGRGVVEKMRREGITHILDARSEAAGHRRWAGFPPYGFTYLNNGTGDDGQPKSPEYFKRTLDFVIPALDKDPNAKVLLHCAAGINRGPSNAYFILRWQGYSAHDAFTLIKTARPIAWVGYRNDADRAIKILRKEVN